MDDHLIEKLRRGEALEKMDDGRQGVPITVQFQGTVPAASRPERKEWLRNHFARLENTLGHLGVHLDPASISVSGQTVQTTCAADSLAELQQAVAPGGHKIEIVRTVQATPE